MIQLLSQWAVHCKDVRHPTEIIMAKKIWSIDLQLVKVEAGKLSGTASLTKDGSVVKDFELSFSEKITSALALHGLKQKMADNYAGLHKAGGTTADHIEAVGKVVDMLNKDMFRTSKVKEVALTLKGMIAAALAIGNQDMVKMAFGFFKVSYDQKLVDKVKSELEELVDDEE